MDRVLGGGGPEAFGLLPVVPGAACSPLDAASVFYRLSDPFLLFAYNGLVLPDVPLF